MAKASTPSRADLQQLAESRLDEAKILLANNLPDGAVYLAGYSLELAFKARICKILDADYPSGDDLKSFFTHRYSTLLKLAGIERLFGQQRLADPTFANNWSILVGTSSGGTAIEGWSESWRYRKLGSVSIADASRFIDALENTHSGILTWLKIIW